MSYAKIKPKTDSPLKYLIEQVFEDKMDGGFREVTFLSYLREHNIDRKTFYRDKTKELTDKSSIPEFRLRLYAQAFDVSIEALCNYTIEQEPVAKLHHEATKSKKQQETKDVMNQYGFKQ